MSPEAASPVPDDGHPPTNVGAVVVSARAAWCGPCRRVAPVIESVAADYAGRVSSIPLDVEADPERCEALGVRSTPTMIGLRDGVEVGRLVGEQSRGAIEALFAATSTGGPSPPVRSQRPRALIIERLLVGAALAVAGALLTAPVLVVVGIGIAISGGWSSARQRCAQPGGE